MKDTSKIERIGNIYGFTGGSFAGMVYGVNGCAPALNTMGGATGTSHSRVHINTNGDGCAFIIRTGYERHAYLNGMMRGGGFYPETGVIKIYEEEEKHDGRNLERS